MSARPPATVAAVALLLGVSSAGAQAPAPGPEVRIRVDGDDEPVVRRGQRIRVDYEVTPGAHVAVFQIDTDGTVRLVHPRDPWDDRYVRGGRSHRLLFSDAPFWHVDDAPGMGYFFVVASPEPLDFSRFRYASTSRRWDLTPVGRHVYRDPYVAMDDYVAALIPDWERVPYALDFAAYHVEERQRYPRFLCYECHGFRPYRAWNPYRAACTSFRVVIYSDPYYYPARRYRGDRVVFVRPPVTGQPRFAFKERARGESSVPLVVDHTPGRERPRIPGLLPPVRRGGDTPRAGAAAGGRVPTDPAGLGPAPRRPSSVLPGRRPTPGGPSAGAERPRLERREVPSRERTPARTRPSRPERRPPARPAPPARPSRGPDPSGGRPEARPTPPPRRGPGAEPRRSPPPERARPSPPPQRSRPQRTPPPQRAEPRRSPPPQRTRPQRSPPPSRAEPRRRPPPSRSRPQRDPPPRAEPRRSAPPRAPARRRPPPASGSIF